MNGGSRGTKSLKRRLRRAKLDPDGFKLRHSKHNRMRRSCKNKNEKCRGTFLLLYLSLWPACACLRFGCCFSSFLEAKEKFNVASISAGASADVPLPSPTNDSTAAAAAADVVGTSTKPEPEVKTSAIVVPELASPVGATGVHPLSTSRRPPRPQQDDCSDATPPENDDLEFGSKDEDEEEEDDDDGEEEEEEEEKDEEVYGSDEE